ncbi:hypothetical protein [Nocardia arthritidis]|uniref:DUF2637 domain-containing protein n=1 Tax=Nocardia arthritidis TaxID=228602 RepID=A0A6G9YPX6_9NOCA|nr:hypothetical protein [Nocardia arthritidis]QIS14973.1 hypothetical protein F5544_35715 [Nocardia arthritidis]
MTIEHPLEDEVTQLAKRVERARGRLAYQFDPALTEALSEDELRAERELAERIRDQDRDQRWKQTQAAAAAADRARHTTEAIEKADMRDLLMARKAIAAQRRESSPHAKLASLYRHRSWSLRALAAVVAAGMLWSAVNVQHNIAPGGPSDPLYWFSYLLEAMISVCLIIIMIGTNKVAEWGVLDSRRQVVTAEVALLALTVTLNTYPYIRSGAWFDAAVHAVAPVMIGVALLIHDAASSRYGFAIARATDQVRELPDPAEQIRRTLPAVAYRLSRPALAAASVAAESEPDALEVAAEGDADDDAPQTVEIELEAVEAALDEEQPAKPNGRAPKAPMVAEKSLPTAVEKPALNGNGKKSVTAANGKAKPATPTTATPTTAALLAETPTTAALLAEHNGSEKNGTASTIVGKSAPRATTPLEPEPPAPPATVKRPALETETRSAPSTVRNGKDSVLDPEPDLSVRPTTNIYDTGQFRVADILEQELAELQAERRRARANKQR